MTLLRRVLGETLRGQRLRQRRTLREVSGAARVSLGYLSEVERGQKEASSELLASICQALDVRMSDVLREVSDLMRRAERTGDVARAAPRPLVPAGVGGAGGPDPAPARPADDRFRLDGGVFDADRSAVPAGADDAALTDHLPETRRADATETAASAALDASAADGVGADLGRPATGLDAELDADLAGPAAGLDASRLEPFRVDVAELDGVDLAELETGDGLGEVEALLGLTDLMCRPDGFGSGPLGARLACAGSAA